MAAAAHTRSTNGGAGGGVFSPDRSRRGSTTATTATSTTDDAPPPPPCPVRSLTAFGQLGRDVLYGNRSEGMYGIPGSSKFVLSSTTAGGVTLTTTATSAATGTAAPIGGQVLAGWSGKDGLAGDLLLSSSGVAEATITRAFALPPPPRRREDDDSGSAAKPAASAAASAAKPARLVVGAVLSLPGLADEPKKLPPKVTFDYSATFLHARASAGLTKRPLLTAAVVAGAGRVGLTLTSAGGKSGSTANGTATLLYGYSLAPGLALGLEAVADVSGAAAAGMFALPSHGPQPAAAAAAGGDGGGEAAAAAVAPAAAAVLPPPLPPPPLLGTPTLAIGASYRIPPPASRKDGSGGTGSSANNGGGGGSGVVKLKLTSSGVASLLYRDTLAAGPRLTLTAQVDTKDLSKAPRLGVTMEL
ncbi:hypothetical protein GPECTOR_16g543 [Gonium pectorale]|uniref:Uncharacterized protein n=1 Tax=Gonium pectorale TaxID=33097 RepID=A0A150GM21_GONPE|nr:hypothetical protein GPECTOR_16g543 [Gonium pectorale]|eukprot:KXZ50370.1 hypothetical protein GPECTOR_16g543 [Gonium pectorale]